MSDLVALPTLIFPTFSARIEHIDGLLKIFDDVRKKFVALTPEEWVRQHCIHWLVSRGYPMGRCSVEKSIGQHGMRYDVMWMDEHISPFLLIECKSPDIKISTDTLRQSAWYNITVKAPYMLLTNGRTAYAAKVAKDGAVDIIPDIPPYSNHENS